MFCSVVENRWKYAAEAVHFFGICSHLFQNFYEFLEYSCDHF